MTRNIYVIPRVHRGRHSPFCGGGGSSKPLLSERPKPGPMLVADDTAGARPFER